MQAKPTILVIEDEAALVTLLRYNLERDGYRVVEARDGEEALIVAAVAGLIVLLATTTAAHLQQRGIRSGFDFLLEPVASRPQLFQADNLHPLAEAQPLILDHVWPAIAPLLK